MDIQIQDQNQQIYNQFVIQVVLFYNKHKVNI